MVKYLNDFLNGIYDPEFTTYNKENIGENGKYVPEYLLGTLYMVEDTYEGAPNIEEMEEEFESLVNVFPGNANMVIEFKDKSGANVEIAYTFGSGMAWYKFVNEVGALSFGMKRIDD